MKTSQILLPAVLILLLAGSALGQMCSVTEATAALRSSPSVSGSYVVLEVPRYYPLEVEGDKGDFIQVRDYRGRDSWIEKSDVGPAAGVVVQTDMANLRSGPGPNYHVVFKARQGVTFQVLEDQSDWIFVEHATGRRGWIYKNLIWGLSGRLGSAVAVDGK